MRRRLLPLAAIALGIALLAASCSTDDPEDTADGTDGASTTTEAPASESPATTGPLGSGTSPIAEGIRIEVLSSQPDRVTGDDARIRVTPPPGSTASELKVQLDEADVTGSLQVVDGSLEGVITGLIEGNNKVTASAGGEQALQRIRAWPLTGPVISGAHLPLLACSTEAAGLGAPLDADCSAAPKVTWRYVTTGGKVADLPDPRRAPADLATTEIDGVDVPMYVRHEVGVINRSVYEISTLDATPGDDDPTGPGWNQRLVYRFGGGCGTTYGQGAVAAPTADAALLATGYAVATASFNNFDVQCNDVLSAETTMMVKERVIEELGVPEFTIGEGSRGGAAQVHLLAQNYPGLVNGAAVSDPLPDVLSVWTTATDCGLLQHYYGTAGGKALTDAQRQAIEGHATSKTCPAWITAMGGTVNPTDGCDPAIDRALVYDAATNRGGIRCTLQDANRTQLGIDEGTGWARRPLDNVGLQYGLEALNARTISFDQFIALNQDIGGYDIDGKIVGDREEADPEAVLHAYETGRVSMGGGDQAVIPIIDVDAFDDPTGSPYDRVRPFAMRDRLSRNGEVDDAPGFQVWTQPAGAPGAPATAGAVAAVDEWLQALRDDDAGGSMIAVLLRTRPGDDQCLLPGADEPLTGDDLYEDGEPCADRYPIAGDPRIAAGGPRSGHVLKCALKPVDPSDYTDLLTDDQEQQLRDTFPMGVCDWDSPSEGSVTPANPDRSYEDVPDPLQDA